MSDLTRYRIGEPVGYAWLQEMVGGGALIPDTTLQDIADAWNRGAPKEYVGDIRKGDVRRRWPQLAALLDALEGTDDE